VEHEGWSCLARKATQQELRATGLLALREGP